MNVARAAIAIFLLMIDFTDVSVWTCGLTFGVSRFKTIVSDWLLDV